MKGIKITEDNLFSISVEKICEKYKVSEEYFRNIFSEFYELFLSKVVLCLTKHEKQLLIVLFQNALIEFKEQYENVLKESNADEIIRTLQKRKNI